MACNIVTSSHKVMMLLNILMIEIMINMMLVMMMTTLIEDNVKEIHPEMPQWKQEYMATSHKVRSKCISSNKMYLFP